MSSVSEVSERMMSGVSARVGLRGRAGRLLEAVMMSSTDILGLVPVST